MHLSDKVSLDSPTTPARTRSYTLDIATEARTELAVDLHLTPAQDCQVGSCRDICTIMISICDAALRADASLKNDLLAVNKTALAEHLKEAASPSRGNLKMTLLAAHTMFEGVRTQFTPGGSAGCSK